ncbi:hypothetical protein OS493_022193 [Desmophyllum pertusum]|uniref:Amine oxidase domain-containing protein n=1 Tax=Desmophyllum pertusum TaxID=174260 RepID=A0A9W9YAT5_9CNID|nr:hypothetical protein OS493_022193 [Desmophyllum pertusum]
MAREKALEVPSYRDFLCHKLGSEGCELLFAENALKREYGEESTLFTYEKMNSFDNLFSGNYVRPAGGLSDIANAVERSAKRFGVKMYAKEKVKALKRKENMFVVQTDNFTVSTKKLVIAAPSFAFKEITGDLAAQIKSNRLFEAILPQPAFKAVAIYSYPWWENVTSSHYNLTLKPFEIFRSAATCLVDIMPYRHLTKAGSTLSKHDLAKWAKRPFPGEQIYMVGEAYSISPGWNEGALMSAYNALKEGWEIEQPEPYL